ncbi:MAG: hypothetical protein LW825_03575 [Candidatus Jidaibacter sp.]|jgi:hypothetical protein|nr:hypothetical protein [Candidatus Jidaibacter sp.]
MIGKTRFDHKRASVLTTAVLRALLQKLAKSGKIGELIKAKVGGYVRF